jgi:MarR family transcriptional regulator, organic hydroperoxide resistance regulator
MYYQQGTPKMIPSKDECICKTIRETARALTNAYDRALTPSGLKTTQFTMLNVIAHLSAAKVTQLGEILDLDQTTVTRNINLLEQTGLVTRAPHQDPRVKLVKLTAQGKQKRQKAMEYWQKAQNKFKSSLSEQEWKTFQKVLQKIENECAAETTPMKKRSNVK